MRVLVTAHGATGHLRPMIGLAQGLERAGVEAIIVTDVALPDDPEFGVLHGRVLPDGDADTGSDGASVIRSQMSRAPAERAAVALGYFLAKSEAWLPTLI